MESIRLKEYFDFSQPKKPHYMKNSSEINKFLSNKYIQNNYEYLGARLHSDSNMHGKNIEIYETKGTPIWYRDTNSEDVSYICFRKPIYSGSSQFNYLPKIVDDNLGWFKKTRIKCIEENNIEHNTFQNEIFIKNKKQHIMTKSQETSRYRYVSPFSEYLLERINWKIALRIYYTLDPEKKGFIELETLKNKLIAMLKVDTEKAQTLLMFLESVTPFFVKEGYIYKDEIISFIAKKISEESMTYGLFSKLKMIFMNPIGRSRKLCDERNSSFINQRCFRKPKTSCENKFKLNPENIMIRLSEMNIYNVYNDYFGGFCNLAHNKGQISCIYRLGFCKTNKAKYSVKGNLQDHIKTSKERKQKLIDKINEEKRKAKDENELECTFKPNVIWPLETYMKNISNKNRNIKNYFKKHCNKKEINIMGYKVISEESSENQNVTSFLNTITFSHDFDHSSSWNEYICDNLINHVYVIHKGYPFNCNRNNNSSLDPITFNEEKEKTNKLQIIAENLVKDFFEIEKKSNDKIDDSKNLNNKTKLINKLRAERRNSFYDPRFKNIEYEINDNQTEFKEKILNINELPAYKEVINHNLKPKCEHMDIHSYYYLPKGYEQISNYFNECKIRKKLLPVNTSINNNLKSHMSLNINISNNIKENSKPNNIDFKSKENISKIIIEKSKLKTVPKVNSNLIKQNGTTNLKDSIKISKLSINNKDVNIELKPTKISKFEQIKSNNNVPILKIKTGCLEIKQVHGNGEPPLSVIEGIEDNNLNYDTNSSKGLLQNVSKEKTISKILKFSKINKKLCNSSDKNIEAQNTKVNITNQANNCEKYVSKKNLTIKSSSNGPNLIKKSESCFSSKNKEQIKTIISNKKCLKVDTKNSIKINSTELKDNHLSKLTLKKTGIPVNSPKQICVIKKPPDAVKPKDTSNVLQQKSNIQSKAQPKEGMCNIDNPTISNCIKNLDSKVANFIPKKNVTSMKRESPMTKDIVNITKKNQSNASKVVHMLKK
ncbi:hypothetical protein RS030_152350 [Cryptosporidium xiaoi]|uniref:EF-hand domain-containing protein n=1 Tax=Cryptosporidium xiaoi TaxID=659607 RepID=A0AAV9Y125_9CRYT